jgi:hypothetical protein
MKNYQLIFIAVWCIMIWVASIWLVVDNQANAAYEQGRQFERAEIHRTLVKCADTHNIYMIPGYPEAFAQKRALKGLKIVSAEKARAAAGRDGK